MAKSTFKKFYYCEYEIPYFIEFDEEKNVYKSSLYTYDENKEDIYFHDKIKSKAEELLRRWMIAKIDCGEIDNFDIAGYNIYLNFPDILNSVRDTNICYHVAETKNRDSILQKGLIPNYESDPDVRGANELIDSLNCGNFPEWLKRDNIVFAHPSFDNYGFSKGVYRDCDLFAVRIDIEKCWVGSIGVSGFCLHDTDEIMNYSEDELKKYRKEKLSYAKTYREHSCHLSELIKNTKSFEKMDSSYGLDEILITHPISSHTVEHIGTWDLNYEFIPNENFKKYVKQNPFTSYEDILVKYKKTS